DTILAYDGSLFRLTTFLTDVTLVDTHALSGGDGSPSSGWEGMRTATSRSRGSCRPQRPGEVEPRPDEGGPLRPGWLSRRGARDAGRHAAHGTRSSPLLALPAPGCSGTPSSTPTDLTRPSRSWATTEER